MSTKRRTWTESYALFFHLKEFEEFQSLRLCVYAVLFHFYLAISRWSQTPIGTRQAVAQNDFLCWPHFQNCEIFYVLNATNFGYSQGLFYLLLYSILIIGLVSAYRRKWVFLHLCLVLLLIWRIFTFGFVTYTIPSAFEYFAIPPALLLVFAAPRIFFVRLGLCILYFLAAVVKFHESWVTGSYFTSTYLKMPLVPEYLIPLATNFVIFLEILAPWGLLSPDKKWRLAFVGLWIFFHVYSSLLVGLTYPTYCIPLLLALFTHGDGFNLGSTKFSSSNRGGRFFGWICLGGLFVLQLIPLAIPGDSKLTQEGYKLGVGMMDANHQCLSEGQKIYRDGERKSFVYKEFIGQHRCPPYSIWFSLQQQCKERGLVRIQWTFAHSINGGPFYQIVNTENACELTYGFPEHNSWIQLPEEGAPVIGFPRPNPLRSGPTPTSKERVIFETPLPDASSPLQRFFRRIQTEWVVFLWGFWISVLVWQGTRVMRPKTARQ